MKLPPSELQPGMVLADELAQQGRVLLKAGAVLTESTINTLRNRHVSLVSIIDGDVNGAGESPVGAGGPVSQDMEYLKARNEIQALFEMVDDDDDQMQLLKSCINRELDDKYRDDS